MRMFLLSLVAFWISSHAAAAEDDAMEAQSCVWRCLADSNGVSDPAYPACVEAKCGDGEREPQSKAQRWEPASYAGEGRRAVVGCSDSTDDESWTCIIVRCENDGTQSLYFDGANGGNPFLDSLEIDGARFKVTKAEAVGTPYTERWLGDIQAIVSAMKGGTRVRILETERWFNADFGTIPLRGSSKAINKLESACRAR